MSVLGSLPAASLGGVEPLVLLSLALALLGVVGGAIPGVPGALLSIAAVGTYWWSGEPAPWYVLAGLFLLALAALAADWLGGVVGAASTGVPTWAIAIAGVAGLVLGLVAGPLGLFAGVAGVVFVAAYLGGRSAGESARAAGIAVVGVLGSVILQVLLAGAVLVGLLLLVL